MNRFFMLSILAALILGCPLFAAADTFDMGAGDADLALQGQVDAAQLGYSVVLGDLNGDGYDDVIASEPGHDEDISATFYHGGRVLVVYGGQADGDVDVVIKTGAPPLVIQQATWELGTDLAVGDVNGDGVDDLLIASRQAVAPDDQWYGYGAVFVIYGDPALPAQIELNPYDDPASLADINIFCDADADHIGVKIAAGDLNNDGIDDIITSNPDRLGGDGAVYVIYGRENFPANALMAIPDDGSQDLEIHASGLADEGLGNGLAAGDVNGDGIHDLLMGTPGTWNLTVSAKDAGPKYTYDGAVYVLFGSAGWTESTAITLSTSNLADLCIYGEGDESNFGYSIAVGDVNGDGIGDIVAGAPYVSGGRAKGSEGKVFVVYGRSDFSANEEIDLASDSADVTIIGPDSSPNLHIGFSIAIGDMDGDCIDDILTGGFYQDNAIRRAFAVYGSDGFPAGHTLQMPADATHVLIGEQDSDLFGFDVALGDETGDLLADMLIGAPTWEVNPNSQNWGYWYLVPSPETNLVPAADAGPDQTVNLGDTVVLDGSGSSDPEGREITYAWTQVSGPTTVLDDPALANPTFSADEYGTYEFDLVVNDCLQASPADTVIVTVPGGDDDDDDSSDDDDDNDDSGSSDDEKKDTPGYYGSGGCCSL